MPVQDANALPSAKPQREVNEIRIVVTYKVVAGVLTPVYQVNVAAQRVYRDPATLAELLRDPHFIGALFEDGQITGQNRTAVDRLVTAAETQI